ncbi:2OG-Fe(II) oxygenase [Brevundimonas sp.]|uniref:2OG-Fe(II) oxygenase n=1 Tax=Brevundimonas sp. TaxID=1871086 RepID=UPI003AF80C5D
METKGTVATSSGQVAGPGWGYRNILAGDPAPTFRQKSSSNPDYVFGSAAGRYIVLCFFHSSTDEQGRGALSILTDHRALFDDTKTSFFGVSVDPADETRLEQSLPGVRWFFDQDLKISRLYGSASLEEGGPVRRLWLVIDPMLRVAAVIPMRPDGTDRDELIRLIRALPPIGTIGGIETAAPVLHLPNVFEAELCERLIGAYRTTGGEPSGFMVEREGRTVLATDPNHKRRRDVLLDDPGLIHAAQERIRRRIVPEIKKVHHFNATRMERYLVALYDEAERGHFNAHRDNTTKGTAHRRFAVSINLNDDFDGGEIAFPEYGHRTYKPQRGAAIVFSCSLLHAVSPVTRGKRFAFLPFLYDDAAAQLREANRSFLADGNATYRA